MSSEIIELFFDPVRISYYRQGRKIKMQATILMAIPIFELVLIFGLDLVKHFREPKPVAVKSLD
jgi:hypothetical protein